MPFKKFIKTPILRVFIKLKIFFKWTLMNKNRLKKGEVNTSPFKIYS
jgi:hypothetical protein